MSILHGLWRLLAGPWRAFRAERRAINQRVKHVHIRVNQLVQELDDYDQDIRRERRRP